MDGTKSSSDRFHPGMPTIPGLSNERAASSDLAGGRLSNRGLRALIFIGAVLLLVFAMGFWILHAMKSRPKAPTSPDADMQDVTAPTPLPAPPEAKPERVAPGEIARLDELSKPWSSVAFTFIRPDTREEVPAIVVRLPGAAGSSESYWAFSLEEPYGKCQLVYVTETKTLSSQFGFEARHPMVGDPCNGAVFDPLRMGAIADGAWVRGEIVQGGALRPPISIEVSIRGERLYADRIE
jgi:hypothetical protein